MTRTPTKSPNSSPEERTDFDSYYFTAGSVTKEENLLFSPLSFSNSSVSSFNDSILNNNTTPPSTPMSPVLFNSITNTTLKSVDEFADIIIDRCNWFLELSDMQYSHIRELEIILNQTQLLMSSTHEETVDQLLESKLKNCREIIENSYHSSLTIKDQEAMIKSAVRKKEKKTT